MLLLALDTTTAAGSVALWRDGLLEERGGDAARSHAERLPGDLVVKRKNFALYVPIVTSLLLSLVVTVLLNLFPQIAPQRSRSHTDTPRRCTATLFVSPTVFVM